MNKLVEDIIRLDEIDQKAIKSFRNGEITQDQLSILSFGVSNDFLNCIRSYGFPYHNLVSEDVYKAAISLALHLNFEEMNLVFNKFIDNHSIDKILPEDKVMFVDKMLVIKNFPQLYGTQYKVDKNMNAELLPIKDIENVDKRRKEAGLGPLSDYVELVKLAFKSKNFTSISSK